MFRPVSEDWLCCLWTCIEVKPHVSVVDTFTVTTNYLVNWNVICLEKKIHFSFFAGFSSTCMFITKCFFKIIIALDVNHTHEVSRAPSIFYELLEVCSINTEIVILNWNCTVSWNCIIEGRCYATAQFLHCSCMLATS